MNNRTDLEFRIICFYGYIYATYIIMSPPRGLKTMGCNNIFYNNITPSGFNNRH